MAKSCDGCVLCCKLISVPALNKPVCVMCEHVQKGKGCGIYEDRPSACAEFECVWLQTQRIGKGRPLGAALRPDRCHVVITQTTDGRGLVFHVDPNHPNAYKLEPVAGLIDRVLRQGGRCFVVCEGKRVLLFPQGSEVLA